MASLASLCFLSFPPIRLPLISILLLLFCACLFRFPSCLYSLKMSYEVDRQNPLCSPPRDPICSCVFDVSIERIMPVFLTNCDPFFSSHALRVLIYHTLPFIPIFCTSLLISIFFLGDSSKSFPSNPLPLASHASINLPNQNILIYPPPLPLHPPQSPLTLGPFPKNKANNR